MLKTEMLKGRCGEGIPGRIADGWPEGGFFEEREG